jgi:hypothetical protein
MTIAEQHALFDLVCDKVASPYFTPQEKDVFINSAQQTLVNSYVLRLGKRDQEGGPDDVFQLTSSVAEALSPITRQIEITKSTNNGTITKAELNTATSRDVLHIVSGQKSSTSTSTATVTVYTNDGCALDITPTNTSVSDVRNNSSVLTFTRASEFYQRTNNTFYAPDERNVIYTVSAGDWKVLPATAGTYSLIVIVRPVDVNITTPVNCELPADTHHYITYLALVHAGVAIREQDFAKMASEING